MRHRTDETAREFMGFTYGSANSLHVVYKMCVERVEMLSAAIHASEMDLDGRIATILSLSESDRRFCDDAVVRSSSQLEAVESQGDVWEEDSSDSPVTLRSITCDVLSFAVGAAFGRWNVSHEAAVSSTASSRDEDLFTPYPSFSQGMLQGRDEVPEIRTLDELPLRIQTDGILVDDAEHGDDLVRRVRHVFEAIWKEQADGIEKETCDNLGLSELRDYFRKPGKTGFWDDHLARYTKSRRKAPIYWFLQSSKKNYALWIYYHRLDRDLLFKALVNYVEPKIRSETGRLEALRSQKAAAGESGKDAKRLAKDVEHQEDFLSELRDFEDKLRRVATLHLEPDLNDGVVLNIAPLWELVPWKEAKNYWDELLKGEYEWSSIGEQLRQKQLVK